MAKKAAGKKKGKKRSLTTISTRGFGTKQDFHQEIQKVYNLLEKGKPETAQRYLGDLIQRYPQRPDLLQVQMVVALELDDYIRCGKAAAQLFELQPNNPDVLYTLSAMAASEAHPLLAWHLGNQALERFPHHSMAEDVKQLVQSTTEVKNELLAEVEGVPRDEAMVLMVNHEWAQLHLKWSEFEKCRAFELKVLEQKPDFMPAYNNLSLVAMMSGEIEEAIAHCEKVLTFEPENIHALANLVHYCFISGHPERASDYSQRLKASKAPAWDPYTKKIEGLSYLGDAEGVLEIWQQAKSEAEDEVVSTLDGLVFHWVAVAHARLGQEKEAKMLWREASKRSPDLEIVKENLNDFLLPVEKRHGPWEFDGREWIPKQLKDDILSIIHSKGTKKDNSEMIKAFEGIQAEHPEFVTWVETMLLRGDPRTRDMVFGIASHVRSPELLEALKIYALSKSGPDAQRNQAASILLQEEVLESNRVRLWIKGEWREIDMIGFELHSDLPYEHSQRVLDLLMDALDLLREQTPEGAKEAEPLLKKALKIKKAPDLLNNLSVAYMLQGRTQEALELRQKVIENYPDYMAARVSAARQHIRDNELEAAEDLLLPVLKRRRIHFEEFVQFSNVYLELLIKKEDLTSAQTWLKVWDAAMPDHPDLEEWEEHLEKLDLANKIKQTVDGKLERKRKSQSKGKGKKQKRKPS